MSAISDVESAPDPGTQSEVIAFLSKPGVIDDGMPAVHVTHIAYVFVGRQTAYKVKRDVRLSFLDFSTLAKRRAACLREIEINRNFAPDIYLGAVPITRRSNGSLAIGGPGEPIEWAVEMRAFDQSAILSERAKVGELDTALCEATADVVYRTHQISEVSTAIDLPKKMRAIVAEVADACRQPGSPLSFELIERWEQRARHEILRLGEQLRERSRSGAVRRCHGDLHLANIVLWQGKPTPFDALEFNDEMATVDTLYDLAFLLMDLDLHNQHIAANRVLNRYLWRDRSLQTLEALSLLPLYMSCRASIRAMVTAMTAARTIDNERARQTTCDPAGRYLDAAQRLLERPPPRLIAIGGISGTGKSTVAAAIAPSIASAAGAIHLRSDLERKALMNVEPTVRLPPQAYTKETSALVYTRVFERAAVALKAGHSVIIDAVFANPNERVEASRIARDASASFEGIWLDAEPDIAKARVDARTGDASDATRDVIDRQLTYDIGPMLWKVVAAGGSPDDTETRVTAALSLGNNHPSDD